MTSPSGPPTGLRVVAVEDVVALIPDLTRFEAAAHARVDVLICAVGFEDRCVAVTGALADAGCTVTHAVLLTYATNPDENRRLYGELDAHLDALEADRTALDVDDPGFNRALAGVLDAFDKPQDRQLRVAFDISVASNQAVMRVLHELLRADCELHVLFTEAESYFPLREEYEADREAWADEDRLNLERGVLNVHFSSEYPGDHHVQLPHAIIVFPGFSRDRARRIITKVDAEFTIDFDHAPVTWMIGAPPAEENGWRRDAVRDIQGIPDDHEQLAVATLDPRDTLRALEQLYARCGLDHNLTLSPMGSKMQAFGAGLFCYARPDVRVAFARPAAYNAGRYSTGVGALWSLTLGDTAELRAALRRVGTIDLLYAEADEVDHG